MCNSTVTSLNVAVLDLTIRLSVGGVKFGKEAPRVLFERSNLKNE